MANFNIDYLVVAGGGGGSNELGGGGGAGGYLTNVGGTAQSLQGTITYTVVVGDGGRGGVIGAARDSENTRGGDGDNSSLSGSNITTITSTGGGGGGAYGPNVIYGRNGGSGGGAGTLNAGGVGTTVGLGNTPSTTPSQGNNGGNSYKASGVYPGGGGGGAGAVGGNYSSSPYAGGNGGDGLPNTITGASPTPYYAGGGGGNGYGGNSGIGVAGVGGNGGGGNSGIGRDDAAANGFNGTNGLGGGGGAATYPPATQSGGSGGSGVLILRYTTADVTSYTTTGTSPTEDTTTVAGQTILSFTTVGTGTITFTTPIPPSFSGTKVTTPVTGFESPVDIGLKIPVGTNSNLPTGVEGMIRNDTDEDSGGANSTTAITFYNGTDWKYFNSTPSQDSPPIENFNTVLYTGTTSPHVINTVGFQPDLIWIKNRDTTDSYAIVDSVRGISSSTGYLASNQTTQEQFSTNMPTSVQSDGFTITGNGGRTNTSGEDYVAWCFKAGGLINKAADFNGSSSIIKSTALGTAFRSQTTLSISAWFKTSQSTRLTIASFSDTNNPSTDLWLGSDSSGDTISFRNVNNGVNNLQFDNAGGFPIRDGAWHHVVFTADSSGTRIYVDGSERTGFTYQIGNSSKSIEMPTSLNQFSIGANEDSSSSGGQWFLNGQINQVRVFTSAVSASQVTELYNETKADNSVLNYPAGANCITAYPLGENADSLDSGYNGADSNVTFGLPGYLTRNNNGTIESTVSVNDILGFSIVSYGGNGTAGATVGHGLDSTPEMLIVKRLTALENWAVYTAYSHPTVPENYLLTLDNASAAGLNSSRWNNTSPTPLSFSLGTSQAVNAINSDYIAYSFASKPGFSKVGSYTGNGSTTGPIVTLGFEPAWLMFKCTTQSGNWIIIDNKRATSNPRTPHLRANSSATDDTGANEYVDFTSTGFQPKGVSNYNNNASGQTYIYLAFAK